MQLISKEQMDDDKEKDILDDLCKLTDYELTQSFRFYEKEKKN